MTDIMNDIEYFKEEIKNGKQGAMCCMLFDKEGHAYETMYYLSHDMDAVHLLGEIELWKLDIMSQASIGRNMVDSYIRIRDVLS